MNFDNRYSDNKRKPRAWLVVSLIVLLVGGGIFYYLFDPLENSFMPQCIFHRLTGLQCMGCGSQRMLHALLHGDLEGAFRANGFALLSLPVIIFMIWVETQCTKRPRLYKKVYSPLFINTVITLLILWLILRNIFGV